MDLWQTLLELLAHDGLAIFLVVGGALVLIWIIRFYMGTIYPDENRRADRELEVRSETATALQQIAAANVALAAAIEKVCGNGNN